MIIHAIIFYSFRYNLPDCFPDSLELRMPKNMLLSEMLVNLQDQYPVEPIYVIYEYNLWR